MGLIGRIGEIVFLLPGSTQARREEQHNHVIEGSFQRVLGTADDDLGRHRYTVSAPVDQRLITVPLVPDEIVDAES